MSSDREDAQLAQIKISSVITDLMGKTGAPFSRH